MAVGGFVALVFDHTTAGTDQRRGIAARERIGERNKGFESALERP
jgi:hypothetical protein